MLLTLAGMPAFGVAKPVPVNPYNLRNPRRDNLWISLAGPGRERACVAAAPSSPSSSLKFSIPGVNLFLKVLSRHAFKSPDVLRAALPKGFFPLEGLALVLYFVVLINIYLAVFNLIPVPPLDGSGILMGHPPDRSPTATTSPALRVLHRHGLGPDGSADHDRRPDRNLHRRDPRMSPDARKIVLSGMRPTGPLHLGNLVGALRNWIRSRTSTAATMRSSAGTP